MPVDLIACSSSTDPQIKRLSKEALLRLSLKTACHDKVAALRLQIADAQTEIKRWRGIRTDALARAAEDRKNLTAAASGLQMAKVPGGIRDVKTSERAADSAMASIRGQEGHIASLEELIKKELVLAGEFEAQAKTLTDRLASLVGV